MRDSGIPWARPKLCTGMRPGPWASRPWARTQAPRRIWRIRGSMKALSAREGRGMTWERLGLRNGQAGARMRPAATVARVRSSMRMKAPVPRSWV